MLEPKDYQKFIDEDINPGDYIVRELGESITWDR